MPLLATATKNKQRLYIVHSFLTTLLSIIYRTTWGLLLVFTFLNHCHHLYLLSSLLVLNHEIAVGSGMQTIIVGSSRGGCLTKLADRNTRVITKRGGKILDLTELAIKAIKEKPADFVYFAAGLPDTTERLQKKFRLDNKNQKYEEFIFNEDPHLAEHRVTQIIRKAEQLIINQNAIPVFSTITPFSIDHWNHHRLRNHYTSHLTYFESYPQQQDHLHTAINAININIRNINRSNRVLTPKPSSLIAYKRRGHWRYRYGKLGDGTHTNNKTKAKWVKIYKETIEKNNNNLATRILESSPHEVEFDYETDFTVEVQHTAENTASTAAENNSDSEIEYGPTYSSSELPDSSAHED